MENKVAIEGLCREFRVRRLELFGSAAMEKPDLDPSDFDFLVEFCELGTGEWADAYFGLKGALETLLSRPVDLVMPNTLDNPYLLRSINMNRIGLYAA